MSIDLVELRRALQEEAERAEDKKTEEDQKRLAEKEHREQDELAPFQITATDFVSEKIRHLLDHLLKYAGEKGKAALKARTGLDVDDVVKTLKSKDPSAAAKAALNKLKTRADGIAASTKEKVGTISDGVKESANKATKDAQTVVSAAQEKAKTAGEAAKSQVDNNVNGRADDLVKSAVRQGGAAAARQARLQAAKEKLSKLRETMDKDISTAKGNANARVDEKSKAVDSYKFGGRNQNLENIKTKLEQIKSVAKSGTPQEQREALNKLQQFKERLQPTKTAAASEPPAPKNEIQQGPAQQPATQDDIYSRSPAQAPAGSEEL